MSRHLIDIGELELSVQQQRICDATTGTIQRMALRVVDVPIEQRAATYDRIRNHYLIAAAELAPESELTRRWVEMTVAAIERLVADFDATGCGHA